jgi:hypothetical protein
MKVKRQKLLYNFDFERSDATLSPHETKVTR